MTASPPITPGLIERRHKIEEWGRGLLELEGKPHCHAGLLKEGYSPDTDLLSKRDEPWTAAA